MSAERPLHRSASTPAERPLDSRTIDADKAEAVVRRTMLDGGTCSVEAEGWRRVLVHDPAMDAPLKRWPWPFSLFSPHRVRFLFYEGTMRASTLTYEKNKLEDAIQYFLHDLPPKAKVSITRERTRAGRA